MHLLNTDIVVDGRIARVARLRNEEFDYVRDPDAFVEALKACPEARADIFTFLQEQHETEPKYTYYHEANSISVIPVSTYEHWLTRQIDSKTRNMIRKAAKCGVELRITECDDEFVRGAREIYNESPIRQGMRFWHYGIDFEEMKRQLVTFLGRSSFVGAYHGKELIGFFKLTRNTNSASVMQIISKISSRDKAPNNALLAKAVELCASLGIPFLQYGTWGSGGLADYKIRHGFTRFDIPRYYVPLNSKGKLAIRLKLYRRPSQWIPQPVLERLVAWRGAWYTRKYSGTTLPTGPPRPE